MCNDFNKLQSVKCFNKARIEIERPFLGLPYGPLLLIKSLINLADPGTGIVNNISYLELTKLIEINPAPGRKESGTPTKQTIRNYIKAIERECGDCFKVISEGQSLKLLFPELPTIFSKFFENREVNTETNTRMALENTWVKAFFDEDVDTDLNTEVNTPNESIKKLFININNNNNNTSESLLGAKNNKQPIAADFYPNQETISRAIASGYSFATNPEIIQEFIDKNTAWGSTYADFNPIYLCFLAKYTQFQQSKQSVQHVKIRNINNERTFTKNNSYEAAMERVRQDNQDAIEPTAQELFPVSKTIRCAIEHEPHFMALG